MKPLKCWEKTNKNKQLMMIQIPLITLNWIFSVFKSLKYILSKSLKLEKIQLNAKVHTIKNDLPLSSRQQLFAPPAGSTFPSKEAPGQTPSTEEKREDKKKGAKMRRHSHWDEKGQLFCLFNAGPKSSPQNADKSNWTTSVRSVRKHCKNKLAPKHGSDFECKSIKIKLFQCRLKVNCNFKL